MFIMFNKKRKIHSGCSHPRVRLTVQEVLEIREFILKGVSQEILSKKYGITNAHVGSIKHRRTWKHI